MNSLNIFPNNIYIKTYFFIQNFHFYNKKKKFVRINAKYRQQKISTEKISKLRKKEEKESANMMIKDKRMDFYQQNYEYTVGPVFTQRLIPAISILLFNTPTEATFSTIIPTLVVDQYLKEEQSKSNSI